MKIASTIMDIESIKKGREIKFRFWVEKAKKMSDWETAKKECDRLSLLSFEGFIPMQFTGLTDKNVVEIYEGDVIQHNGNKYYIKFSKNQFCLLAKEIGGAESWRSLEWLNRVSKYIAIIGNLYTNPELLIPNN